METCPRVSIVKSQPSTHDVAGAATDKTSLDMIDWYFRSLRLLHVQLERYTCLAVMTPASAPYLQRLLFTYLAGCLKISSTEATCAMGSISFEGFDIFEFVVKAIAEGQFNATSSVDLAPDSNKTTNGPVVSEVTSYRTCGQYDSSKAPYECPNMYGPNDEHAAYVVYEGNETSTCCVS